MKKGLIIGTLVLVAMLAFTMSSMNVVKADVNRQNACRGMPYVIYGPVFQPYFCEVFYGSSCASYCSSGHCNQYYLNWIYNSGGDDYMCECSCDNIPAPGNGNIW
jgi:hypothetical protein